MINNIPVEVLLIEDNPEDAELTIRVLKKHHLANNLIHLQDGEAALDFLFAEGSSNIPRLILLDLKMPKMSGMQVLEKVKSDDELKSIPVVILTSSQEDPDIAKCYSLGANSYIVKPVDSNNFFNAIKEMGMYWMILSQPAI